MSENLQAECSALSRQPSDKISDLSSRFVPLANGRVARIDPPVDGLMSSSAPSSISDLNTSNPAMPDIHSAPRPDEELLTQATQLIGHLKNSFSELHQRDQALATQLQQLEQDRRSLRQWKADAEQELQDKKAALQLSEAALKEHIADQQQMVARLRNAQAALDQQRSAVDAERIRMFADVAGKVDAERDRLQQAIADTEEERQRLQADYEQQRVTLEESWRVRRQEIEVVKTRVRQDVTEETLTAELRTDRDSLRTERAEFERLRSDWLEQRDREQAELSRQREVQQAAVARVREELYAERQQQAEELNAQQREQLAALEQAKEEFAKQRDQQMLEMKHERVVLENRLRFQQEHLAKARQEIATAQNEFRLEAQRTRSQLDEAESVIRLRKSQLERVRSLLEERERSVNREREMLLKSQRAFQEFTVRDRERLKAEQEDWDCSHSTQLADLRRQQDMLTLHVQNLEGRRERLDKLRAELEETHRETLEMRMAIEEAWAQMTQSCGEEVAQQRIDAARQQLSGRYRHLREALTEQRRELEEMQVAFQQQKDGFRSEQQTLTEWATDQDRKQRDQEESLKRQAEQLDLRESAWRSASQRWINEKIEAEVIIRDLLQQLTALTEPASPVSMWPNPLMPVYE